MVLFRVLLHLDAGQRAPVMQSLGRIVGPTRERCPDASVATSLPMRMKRMLFSSSRSGKRSGIWKRGSGLRVCGP